MAEMNGKNITGRRKRLSINLSLFTLSENPAKLSSGGGAGGIKSPKNFEEPNGVVGLGILAAMNKNDSNNLHDQFFKRAAVLAVSPRSTNPIPILSNKKHTSSLSPNNKTSFTKRPSVEEMELCEEYTCVISRGDNQIKKIEYFEDGVCLVNENLVTNDSVDITANISAAVSPGGEAKVFQMADFLSSCFLCEKKLHGLDIFMYRGEKAFCSVECRCKQIAIDEHKEKCVSGGRKQHEYSVSPCSNKMQFFAGVAAA